MAKGSRAGKPNLTKAQKAEIVALVGEGIPIWIVAAKFNVTSNALYMHKTRKSEFGDELAEAIETAEADSVISLHRELRKLAKEGVSTWTGIARLMQWTGHYQTPDERAAVELSLEKAKQLREGAINPHLASEPDPRFA